LQAPLSNGFSESDSEYLETEPPQSTLHKYQQYKLCESLQKTDEFSDTTRVQGHQYHFQVQEECYSQES
jgi:hypothetical protein